MKMWILLLCATVSSMDVEYNPYDVKSTDVVDSEPGKYPVARKCVKVMFYAGCVYGLYCFTQLDAYCGEQSSEIQQAKSYALIEAAKTAKNYVVCGAAIPVWNKCKDIFKLAYDKGKSSEKTFMKSTESLMECMDLNPKDMEECNFYHTRKNRLLKIKNKEDAKLKSENEEDAKFNSEKLSLSLNASELYLYKQIGEGFVGVGKYITLEELENAVSAKKGLGHSFKLKIERENGKVEHVFQTKDELDAIFYHPILNPSKINSNEDKKPKQSDKGTQKKDGTSATIIERVKALFSS